MRGTDYINTSQVITFAPGETSKTFTVQLCRVDFIIDPFETVILRLTNPVGAGLGSPSQAVLTSIDTANQFENRTPITINGGLPGVPYPSQINVQGATTVFRMRVTLYDFYHVFPDNVDVLLVSPAGTAYVLMGDVGNGNAIPSTSPRTITFWDQASQVLPDSGVINDGAYRPTTCEPVGPFPVPAPPPPYIAPGCTLARPTANTLFGAFGGQSANGIWSLYVVDDGGGGPPPVADGEAPQAVNGEILGGWGLEILAATANGVEVSGRVTTPDGRGLRNAEVVITDSRGNLRTVTTSAFGHYSFTDIEPGTYVVSVNSRRYRFGMRVLEVADNLTDVDFVAQE